MSLMNGDLQDTVLKNISIDEFEPKTGDLKDVCSVGFYVTHRPAGSDLYDFLQRGVTKFRDVELTPNPTEENYYMVFIELDRNKELADNIDYLLKDVSNLAGNLDWHYRTHIMNDYEPWKQRSDIMSDPKTFMDVDQYQIHMAEAAETQRVNGIMEFFKASDLSDVTVEGNVINLKGGGYEVDLEMVGMGEAHTVMADAGLSEAAMAVPGNDARKFQGMLGNLRAAPVAGHFVLFYPDSDNIMVVRPNR